MSYTVEYDSTQDMIRVDILGKVEIFEIREILEEIVFLAKQSDCIRVLSDLRQVDLNRNFIEAYLLPGHLIQIAVAKGFRIRRSFKRASVAVYNRELFDFYEKAPRSSGHQMKLFHDIEAAQSWLMGGIQRPLEKK